MNFSTSNKSLKIALIAYNSLGDGLVFLTIADNMRQAGFDISYFSHFMFQLRSWFPLLKVHTFPDENSWDFILDEYDIILMDAKCPFMKTRDVSEYPILAEKYIFIAATRVDERLIVDHTEQFKKLFNDDDFKVYQHYAGLSGPLYTPNEETVVDSALSFCKKMGIESVHRFPELTIPEHLKFRRYKNRVIISPMTPNLDKNWGEQQFMKLARELKQQSCEVNFVVAPNEYDYWQKVINNEFSLPLFPDISKLGEFIYESGALVSNDSGNGHFASLLKIPTITIFKKNKKFPWRPGWLKGTVITPVFTIKLLGKRYWRPFISIKRVKKAVISAISAKENSPS